MEEQDDIVREFLVESNENLTQLDQDFVELEKQPQDTNLLSSIFRTIHTIKGTCGFLGFSTLEAITHRAENMLSQLRDGERGLTPALTTLLLETFDIVKTILGEIEQTGTEGPQQYEELRARLQAACENKDEAPSPADEPVVVASETVVESSGEVEEPVEATLRPPVPAPPAATPEPAPAESAPAGSRQTLAESNIRVSVNLLDNLMNLVGELVLARNQVLQFSDNQQDTNFTATSQRLNLITTELQANVMKTRMQPIRVVWNKFPRVVRDLGQSVGKQIELKMEGADTELDKTIIEAIKDPLTHLVRNSCDHGLEPPEERGANGKPAVGTLLLRAYHEGGQVNIEISDDGRGIDPEKLKSKAIEKGLLRAEEAERMSEREVLNMIFMAGFSTAQKVTNVSGRGVGMDVVRTNIEKIGGSIDLQSQLGQGTTIKIKIPLTLAIIPALIVKCGSDRFAIPQVNLVELLRVEPRQEQQIESISGTQVYRLRGKLLPLVYLSDVLGLKSSKAADDESVSIVVLQADDKTFGLVVDGVNDTAEIVVKPLSKLLKGAQWYAGATIMGDGYVALILDVLGLAQQGGVLGAQETHAHAAQGASASSTGDRQTVVLFRSGDQERLAVPLGIVDRLEEFDREKIETSSGRQVVQYRGRILALLPLNEILGAGESRSVDSDKVQVVVFSEGERQVGVIVDTVEDIVEDAVTVRTPSDRPGFLGSAVVGGSVTDFIDLQYLIGQVDEKWFAGEQRLTRVLLTESSSFSRGLLRNYLEMAGCAVFEAAGSSEAIEQLRREPVDVLLTSLDLPDAGARELLRRVRGDLGLMKLPTIALSNHTAGKPVGGDSEDLFDDYQHKLDREAMLRSVIRLAHAVECEESADPQPAADLSVA